MIPFVEVVGKAAKVAPAQIGATWVNAGVVAGFTTIVIGIFVVAHCPGVLVNI